MRKSVIATLAASSVLVACATGPVPIGKDTYMMGDTAATVFTNSANLKVNMLKEANALCAKDGKQILLLDENGHNWKQGFFEHSRASAEIKFECVEPNDTRLAAKYAPAKISPDRLYRNQSSD